MTHSALDAAQTESAAAWLPLDELRPWERNPRKNDGLPVEAVAASIRQFGFIAPIVIWRAAGRMVAGHTRLKALRAILAADPAFVPRGAPRAGVARVVFHDFQNEAEADAYAVADNRLGELATWDDAALADVLDRVRNSASLPIERTGFSDTEVNRLLAAVRAASEQRGEDVVPAPPKVAVTRPGDLWLLGEHRLLCGDSTHAEDVRRVADATAVDLLWTDPPYNVAYVGKTKDALTIQNDAMAADAFRAFLVGAFRAADAAMRPGAAFYVAHADSEGFNFRGATIDVGWKLAQCIIWVKDQFVMGRQDYHWRHGPILYGWKLGAGHQRLKDRTQDTVWECDRPRASAEHPTMKPVPLIERAINNSTSASEIVLDTFGGSGSTLIAATNTGRRARLVELDPRYVDVIVERWEHMTGGKATRTSAVAA